MGRFSLHRAPPQSGPTVEAPSATASPLNSTPAPPPAPAQTAATVAADQQMLEIKLKLHARLIEELDLSKLDKLDESELRRQVMALVGDFARGERMVLNSVELEQLGSSVYDEMVGLGPIEPLLKDESINDILINGPFQV
jgi:pilus assembly protein CpaF